MTSSTRAATENLTARVLTSCRVKFQDYAGCSRAADYAHELQDQQICKHAHELLEEVLCPVIGDITLKEECVRFRVHESPFVSLVSDR